MINTKSNTGLFIHTENNWIDLDERADGLEDYFLKNVFLGWRQDEHKTEAAIGNISW